MRKVDVAIIGAGTAGLSARSEVAAQTDNYVVIDPGPLGTTCARVGCMPSKVLIQIANDFHSRHRLHARGVKGTERLELSVPAALEFVRSMRDEFVAGVLKSFRSWEDHYVPKRAKFLRPDLLDCEGEQIQARTIIIATGSSPVIPTDWQSHRKHLLTTDELFEQKDLPEKMAIIGLGVIGLEMGQALSRMGIEVHAYTQNKRLGGLTDPRIQEIAAEIMSQEMRLSFNGAQIIGVEKDQLIIESRGEREKFDQVLVTVGRRPNTSQLGLEEIGIKCDRRGVPDFNKETFKLPGHDIFLAGDVLAERSLLHEATDEGRMVGYNAAHSTNQCFQRRTQMAITFCAPEIAKVGASYDSLTLLGTPFISASVDFKNQGRSRIIGENQGRLTIYADPQNGKILGAEMMAPEGEHMAHLLAWGISSGLTVATMLSMPFYHPVVEEGLRKALRDLNSQTELEKEPLEILRCQDAPVEKL